MRRSEIIKKMEQYRGFLTDVLAHLRIVCIDSLEWEKDKNSQFLFYKFTRKSFVDRLFFSDEWSFSFRYPWTIYMMNGMRSDAIRWNEQETCKDRNDAPRHSSRSLLSLCSRRIPTYRIVPPYDLPMQVSLSCTSDFQSAVADKIRLRTPQRKKITEVSNYLQLSLIFPWCTNWFTSCNRIFN